MIDTPHLYPVRDKLGNRHYAGIQYDELDGKYVASITNFKGVIIGLGVADHPGGAAAEAAIDLDARKDA